MSIFDKDKLFLGLFSTAGIVSAEKYNILEEFQKVKQRNKNNYYHDSFLPDKEWQKNLTKKEMINNNDIMKDCKFNIDELKSEINKQNLYFKEDSPIKIKKKSINRSSNSINKSKSLFRKNKKNLKNPIINRKYKYHDLHMKRIARYKKEGIYDKILNQQESTYYPKFDYVYKKIESGPKWEKLVGRGKLFEPDHKKIYSLNIVSYDEIEKQKEKEKYKIKSRNIFVPKLIKDRNNGKTRNKLESGKYSGILTKSTSTYSKINIFNKDNIYIPFIYDNTNYNNHNNISSNKSKNESDKKSILKNPNNTFYNIPKCKSVIEFSKYINYEKLENKKKRNQEIKRLKNILNPNYSSIEGEIKMFVKYNTNSKKPKNKTIIFEGINSNELLYDANSTFEKIYGNKLKAVPIFRKMMARPNDINLPSYMKGLYSRLGLHLASEKTLQMNNFENSKMYKFDGDFTPKKNKYNSLRKVYFEEDLDNEKNKIEKNLELMKKKFRNIQFHIYE